MDYSYDSVDTTIGSLLGGFYFLAMILLLVVIAAFVVGTIAYWKLFKKAGKKGWESIVPFYSYWVLVEISGLNWWWFLLIICSNIVSLLGFENLEGIASLVSLFASFNCYYNIAKKFGKQTGYSIFAGIFSFIFVLILGLSKKEVYNANIPVSNNGVFKSTGVGNNDYQSNMQQPVNNSYQSNMEQPTNNFNTQYQSETNLDNTTTQEFCYCGNCGTKLNKNTRFCPNCGKQNV